jgi:hypothetical protein
MFSKKPFLFGLQLFAIAIALLQGLACSHGVYAVQSDFNYQAMHDVFGIYDLNNTADVNISFQLRTCSSPICSDSGFLGPDGTSSTWFRTDFNKNNSFWDLNVLANNRYFQYNARFVSADGNYTPRLYDTNVIYNTFPADVNFSVGRLDLNHWSWPSGFDKTTTVNDTNTSPSFSAALNTALSWGTGCSCIGCTYFDVNNYCTVPFYFSSSARGSITLSSLSINYTALSSDVNVVYPSNSEHIEPGTIVDVNLSVFSQNAGAERLLFDINYSTSQSEGTGIVLVADGNVAKTNGLRCDSNSLSTAQKCRYSWNTAGVASGTYYILAKIKTPDINQFKAATGSFFVGNVPDVNALSFTVDENVWLKGGNSFSLDWNASDADTNAAGVLFDLNINSAKALGGTVVLQDGNVATTANLWCDGNNLVSAQKCHYLYTVPNIDSNFYFVVKARDSLGFSDWNASSRKFSIDMYNPSTIWDGNTAWQTFDANIHLTCIDNNSGCNNTKYRIDSNSTIGINMGNWLPYDTNILINNDGNWAIDFNSTDNVGNIGDTNRFYVLVDKTAPTTCNCPVSGNWNITDGSNCILSTTCDLGANLLYIQSGTLTITSTGYLKSTSTPKIIFYPNTLLIYSGAKIG